MLAWLTGTTVGKLLRCFILSMVPVLELRFAIPYGVLQGLEYHLVALASILGNLVPVPIIIIYVRKVFAWMRRKHRRLDDWVARMEKRAEEKGEKVRKYGILGLCLLVAIPVPGTGAWTGSLVAAILGLRLKEALPPIILGVIIAAMITLSLTFGVSYIF